MRSPSRAIGALIVLALVLQSCDNNYGIFSEVQKEVEQVGQDFFKKKPVSSVVAVNSSYYAVATTILYSRPSTGSSWTRMYVDGRSDLYVYGIAATAAALYVSTSGGVFSFDGNAWTSIGAPSYAPPSGMRFYTDGIFSANNQVYVVGHLSDPDSLHDYYCLYRVTGVSSFESITPMASSLHFGGGLDADETIRGVAYGGGNFWFAAENHLYSGTNNLSSPTSHSITGIWSLSSTRSGDVYIGTSSGTLYRNGVADSKLVSTEGNPLSCVVEVPLDSGTWKLLVGTEVLSVDGKKSAGYFEGTNAIAMPLSSMSFPPGKDAPVTSSSSIYSTSVNDKPVRAFLYDGDTTAGTLFIGISPYASTKTYYGLYSSTWNNGTSWSGWRAE